ncbi:hypothetical protein HPB48_000490 [Haemaphysalis longicornis]|uniref:Uncharacterized protein n=1 Tax=Haemaphysalis longicornis TaxID=44386 RepID=A0A9J6G3U5_HAELO|nr:hypothetical protein HPB48_000490 [Haemaphysalis longicornis]
MYYQRVSVKTRRAANVVPAFSSGSGTPIICHALGSPLAEASPSASRVSVVPFFPIFNINFFSHVILLSYGENVAYNISSTPIAADMPETTSQPVILSHFVDRVTSLPVVVSALDTAKQSYNHVKDINGLLGYTLSTAEKSAAYAVGHSRPLLEKLARPISYVDSLACKGLDRIEQSYPAVKQNSPQGHHPRRGHVRTQEVRVRARLRRQPRLPGGPRDGTPQGGSGRRVPGVEPAGPHAGRQCPDRH